MGRNRTVRPAIGLVALASALALAPGASARTIDVPKDRPTIQGAVNAADPGDRVLIKPKTRNRRYFENVTVTTNRIEIVGDPRGGELPLVDGTSREGLDIDGIVFDIDANNVTLRRLALRNGNGVDCTGLGCTFSGVESRMSDQGGDCIEIDGGQGRVERSSFIGCGDNAVDTNGNAAQTLGNRIRQIDNDCIIVEGDRARVVGNTIRGCEDSEGMDVDGNRAKILDNAIRTTDSNAYEVFGNGNLVRGNSALNIEDDCFDVDGIRNRVIGNRATVCDGGFEVSGENMTVAGNRGTLLGDDNGFEVDCMDQTGGAPGGEFCRGAALTGNLAADNNNDDDGFDIFVDAPGLLVAGNRSRDNNDGGFRISGDRVTIRGNVSVRDGAEGNEPGFELDGDNLITVGNKAVKGGDDGFELTGDNQRLRRNVSRNNNGDGVFMENGNAGLLKLNTVIGNNGDGIDNGSLATNTRVIRNVSQRNRKDCTNDGTIAAKRGNRCADGSNFNVPGTLNRPAGRR